MARQRIKQVGLIVLPLFAVTMLHRRIEFRLAAVGAVFSTRNGTGHQVTNVERRWHRTRNEPVIAADVAGVLQQLSGDPES